MLSWGWTASPGPYPCPCSDFIVSQVCGNHRAWEGGCATQVCAKPTLSRFPLAPGLSVAPLLAAPPPLSLCCSLRAEASGMRLGSEPASSSSSSRGLLPWLPARPRVFRFSGEVLGSSCCQRAEGSSNLRGLLAVGPALPPAPFPPQELQFLALETWDSVDGLPASVSLEFMKRQLLT